MTEVWQEPTPRVRFREVSVLMRCLLRGSWLYLHTVHVHRVTNKTDLTEWAITIPHCLFSYSYCMSDLLCPIYNIPLTSCHLPERPEGTYCTVLKPAQYGEERSRQRQQAATASRGGAAWEDNGPYGAQDYRYKEEGVS